jgi:hypothetical protein
MPGGMWGLKPKEQEGTWQPDQQAAQATRGCRGKGGGAFERTATTKGCRKTSDERPPLHVLLTKNQDMQWERNESSWHLWVQLGEKARVNHSGTKFKQCAEDGLTIWRIPSCMV